MKKQTLFPAMGLMSSAEGKIQNILNLNQHSYASSYKLEH